MDKWHGIIGFVHFNETDILLEISVPNHLESKTTEIIMPQDSLYSESFDFKFLNKKPSAVICLFFMPRSGSTLLACLMQQTKALGFPLEYFDVVNLDILSRRLPGFSLSNLDPLIRVRTSPNGLFSFKLSNLLPEKAKNSLLDRLNPQHFLIIERLDREAQARSLAIAIQTRQWVQLRGEKAVKLPRLTKLSILKAMTILDNERNIIREFVSKRKISALYITYEELTARPNFVVRKICNSFNIQNNHDVDINKVPILKQS